MSKLHELNLYLHHKHAHKLEKGDNIQLKHEELIDSFRDGPDKDAELKLYVAKKTHTKIKKALEEGRGCRIKTDEIHGGAINWKKVGNVIQKIAKHPITKQIAHVATQMASNYAQSKGMSQGDANFAANIANNLIDSHVTEAKHMAISEAKQRGVNALNQYGQDHNLDTSGLSENIMGAGFYRRKSSKYDKSAIMEQMIKQGLTIHKKGSAEAKEHMAHLRSLKNKKETGKGIPKINWGKVGNTLKPVGKNILKGLATGALGVAGDAMGGPLGGIVLSSAASPYINSKIDGLGFKHRKTRGGSFKTMGGSIYTL